MMRTNHYHLLVIWILVLLGTDHPAFPQVSGQVKDQMGNAPIEGALVTLQATSIQTTTDVEGRFVLEQAQGSRLVVVAAYKGYYNASITVASPASAVEIRLEPTPRSDNPEYLINTPFECALCHPDQINQWLDSPMANAGTNTWLYDIYSGDGTESGEGGFVYLRDSVHAQENPASECAACHQPELWVQTPHSPLDPIAALSQGSLHGVSCEVCHKIAHIDESKPNYPGIYPGVVVWTRPGIDDDQVQYGVQPDTDYNNPLGMRPSYQPQLTAAMCAACHQDKNDADGDGLFEEDNGVVSEPTYLEWLNSPYGDPASPQYATCVDCHMPSYGAAYMAQWWGYMPPPRDPERIRSHRIEGTTPQFLENAASLDVTGQVEDDELRVQVVVTNDKTGHHMPTGVTIRNVILLVEAWRAEDDEPLAYTGEQSVHELGGVGDPDRGYYAGLPGKLYAKHNRDRDGNGPTFFTDAVGIEWDTRIPAMQADSTDYTFALPDEPGTYRVRARLVYRRSFRFLVDAKKWIYNGHGQPLKDVDPPHFGHLMAQQTWAVNVATAVLESDVLPAIMQLEQTYPNPFNAFTTIRYALDREASIELGVYDVLGRQIRALVTGLQRTGQYAVVWDGRDAAGRRMASGVYFCKLRSGQQEHVGKMLLLQ